MTRPKLKIGFFLDTDRHLEWVDHILRDIESGGFAETVLIFRSSKTVSLVDQDSRSRQFLYHIYSRLEERRLSGQGRQLLKLLKPASSGVLENTISCNPEEPSDDVINQLKDAHLDILINLSQFDLSQDFLPHARLGIWQLCYGQTREGYRKQPDGFWENYYRTASMDCMLICQSYLQDASKILYHVTLSTNENRSALINRIQAYLYSAAIIPRKLRELYEQGEHIFHHELKELKLLDDDQLHAAALPEPTNIQMLWFLLERMKTSIRSRIRSKTCNLQWTLRYRFGQGVSTDFKDYQELIPTRDGWWADPFLVYDDDKYHLFFEDALLDKDNANISMITMGADGSISDPVPCLVRPYHLSYPFVFEWEGEYYMIPESKGNKTIEVYKASRFPDTWDFYMNMMEDVEAVDTTLYFHEGKWWLFTNIRNTPGLSIDNELSIFYADSPLTTDWKPHPKNPVVTDVRRARPAGRIYELDGKTIRPSQDSSVRYGYGMRLNEIITLNEKEYQEREVEYIEPNWGKRLQGTHTIAHTNDLTVIDVLEWRPRSSQRVS